MVRVVVAPKGERQAVDRDPIQLTRVAIRLLDLADQRAVHRRKTSIAAWAWARPPSGHAPRPVMTVVPVTLHLDASPDCPPKVMAAPRRPVRPELGPASEPVKDPTGR